MSITVTLDAAGKGEMSLVPFIRDKVMGSGFLNSPLYCEYRASFSRNKCRGYIDLSFTVPNEDPATKRVYYVFGNYAPKVVPVTDVYRDFINGSETWLNIDAAIHYASDGTPTTFDYNWCDVKEILRSQPSGDFYTDCNVAWFYGYDYIRFTSVRYHFRYDCRTDNMVKLRWLDADGNINCRKFVKAGRNHTASASSTWQRPHNKKTIDSGYDFGRDEWSSLALNDTMSVGDDNIPIVHYDWVKTIVGSAAVEAYIDSAWKRVSIGDATMECDPRKSQFSVTLSLILPTDDVQQF